MKLSNSQQEALELVLSGQNVRIFGEAGSGKSFLVETIREKFEGDLAITATTGLAALNIEGKTIHSWLKTGLSSCVKDVSRRAMRDDLPKADLLLIDEISFVDGAYFDMIYERLRQGMDEFPQIVLIGDPGQLPPVKLRYPLEESSGYKKMNFTDIHLKENFRQSDPQFKHHLQKMRDMKTFSSLDKYYFNQRLIDRSDAREDTVFLFATNKEVDNLNNTRLELLEGKGKSYSPRIIKNKRLSEKMLKSMLIDNPLKLKEGAQVLITSNCQDQGLVNGDKGIVIKLKSDSIILDIFRTGETIELSRKSFLIRGDFNQVVASYEVFPLKLGWAMSVHKSQGLTLDHVTFDPSNVFDPRLIYVACSRVRRIEDLNLLERL